MCVRQSAATIDMLVLGSHLRAHFLGYYKRVGVKVKFCTASQLLPKHGFAPPAVCSCDANTNKLSDLPIN